MSTEPKLVERIQGGDFETHWFCDPPPWQSTYRVLRQEWNEDLTVRRIYEIDRVSKDGQRV